MTNADKIVSLLREHPGLDDDEISSYTGIRPRQQVNNLCRNLKARGVINRDIGPNGKLVNWLAGGGDFMRPGSPPVTKEQHVDERKQHGPLTQGRSSVVREREAYLLGELNDLDRGKTLVIIPCSGSKAVSDKYISSSSAITDYLDAALKQRLLEARRNLAEQIQLDESSTMPAWRRYTGALYRTGLRDNTNIESALRNVAIVSGGYGVVLANEAIGSYEAVFKPSNWPVGLLSDVLLTYVKARGFESVVAFVSATTAYCQLLRGCQWLDARELRAIYLVSPESSKGAMVKAPTAQGEALAAFLDGSLATDFTSSHGLRLQVHKMSGGYYSTDFRKQENEDEVFIDE